MTRLELIQVIAAKNSRLTEKKVGLAVRYIFDQITEDLGSGKRIEIRRFGSFSVRYRAPRMKRNPKTGVSVRKTGEYSLHFKPGKEMRDRVNVTSQ